MPAVEPTTNLSASLRDAIAQAVANKQRQSLRSFVGKYIVRSGETYLLVRANDKTVTLSAPGTVVKDTIEMETNAFLGKLIELAPLPEKKNAGSKMQ